MRVLKVHSDSFISNLERRLPRYKNVGLSLLHALLFLAAWGVFFGTGSASASASPDQTKLLEPSQLPHSLQVAPLNILVLHSYHPNMPWVRDFDRGLKVAFENAGIAVNHFDEFLDASRLKAPADTYFADYLRTRYADTRIDYFVIFSDSALDFHDRHRNLFPQSRTIRVEYAREHIVNGLHQRDDTVSLQIAHGFKPTLAEMLTLGNFEQIFVVADTKTAGDWRVDAFKHDFGLLNSSKSVTYLLDLSMAEYRDRLAQLPENSAIFYLLLFKDPATGRRFTPYEAVQDLAQVANAPIFAHTRSLLGSGVVGGSVVDAERLAALVVANIQQTRAGETFLLPEGAGFSRIYDARQMDRWGLDRSRLPMDAELLFDKPSLWEAQREAVLVAAAVGFTLLLGVIALRIQVQRKTRALKTRTEEAEQISVELVRRRSEQDRIFAIIGHELRTPAAGLAMQLADANSTRAAMRETSEHLLSVLDDLSTVINPDKAIVGKTIVAPLSETIRKTLTAHSTLMQSGGVKVHFVADTQAERPYAINARLLRQITLNLMKNCVLHSGARNFWIRVDAVADQEGRFEVHYADDGCGIPSESQADLFNAFVRGASQADGTGLGLYLSRKFAQEHFEGDLNYRERGQGGSVFVLSLKLEAAAADPVTAQVQAKKRQDSSRKLHNDWLTGKRVLIAEDNATIRTITREFLRAAGAEVIDAVDGTTALYLAQTQAFDLLLSDVFMPNLDGYQLVAKLRAEGFTQPMIAVTAATIGEESEKMLEAGADAVLPKPMTLSNLQTVLNQVLEKRAAA